MELLRYQPIDQIYQDGEFVRGWMEQLEVERKDVFEHSLRVTFLAIELGKYTGIEEEDILTLAQASMLHDIGKLMIPEELLLKDRLTEKEKTFIDQHVRDSFVSVQEQLPLAAEVIISHHEFQQRSYPRKERRENNDPRLNNMQEILALVDQTDSLLSVRSYKEAWSRETTREYLLQEFNDEELVNKAIDLRLSLQE